MNRGAKGDTLRKLCDDVQREGPAGCGAFQASIQPLYFMSGHGDIAVYNAFHACR